MSHTGMTSLACILSELFPLDCLSCIALYFEYHQGYFHETVQFCRIDCNKVSFIPPYHCRRDRDKVSDIKKYGNTHVHTSKKSKSDFSPGPLDIIGYKLD